MKAQLSKVIFQIFTIIFLVFFLGWIDYQTGYELNFFVFYFIPISIAAWLLNIEATIFISVLCTTIWAYADNLAGHAYSSQYLAIWNTLIRLFSFLFVGYIVDKVFRLLHSERIKVENLQMALSEIKILESFLSICCVCKKIRAEDGSWQQLESYISEHSGTEFSHGYCPDCAKKAFQEAGLTKK